MFALLSFFHLSGFSVPGSGQGPKKVVFQLENLDVPKPPAAVKNSILVPTGG